MTLTTRTATALAFALFTPGCFWTVDGDDDEPADTGDDDDDGNDDDDANDDDDGADVTGGDANVCTEDFTLAGTIEGEDAAFAANVHDTTFYNVSLEEVVFEQIDFELMEALGLSPEDPEDRARFAYFSKGFELRNLYTETIDEYYDIFELLPKTRHDVSIAFFDLSAHDVQPGTDVAVFDASSIEPVRASGDRDALGAELRVLIDDMRSNGQPDLVVTYAPDRSDELVGNALWIAMLSPNGRFATSGVGSFHELLDAQGEPLSQMTYPMEGIEAVSITVDVAFASGESLSVDAECMPVAISG
jgi:hypothetical protein